MCLYVDKWYLHFLKVFYCDIRVGIANIFMLAGLQKTSYSAHIAEFVLLIKVLAD